MVLAVPKRHVLRILVVDDCPDSAESMALLLRIDGNEVDVAFDGKTALAIADKNPPNVVLCDLSMPGMTGYEIAHCLRGMLVERPLLVAITAFGLDEDRQRSQAAGFDRHFVKPADFCAVRQLLRDFSAGHIRPHDCSTRGKQ